METPVGPPVPIVKNSADFATVENVNVETTRAKTAEKVVIIFFMFSPMYYLI